MKIQNNIRLCLLTVLVAGIAAAQPKVDVVENNYSFAPPGSPNYGIAQGSLFAVKGTALGPVQVPVLPDLSQGPLTTTLSGVSVNITVNGVTAQAPLYYVSAGQDAGVLPSNTPVGTGTLTVSYNGQTSAAAPITVVASAFGLSAGVLNASNSYAYVTAQSAANPGETIILWGSGLGASPGDETKYPFPQVDLQAKVNAKVYVGGQSAQITYAGRSQFPAVDQINIVVPAGVSGCNVAVIVQTGNFVSNSSTIAVAPNGRTCSDQATTGLSTSEYQTLLAKGAISTGFIGLTKTTTQTPGITVGGTTVGGGTSTSDSSVAYFARYSPAQFTVSGGTSIQQTSFGGCTTYQLTGLAGSIPTVTPPTVLDAGDITMKLPNVSNVTVTKDKSGFYFVSGSNEQGSTTPLFIPSAGGAFSFTNTGSADVGQISGAQITMPPALNWMNMDSISTIVRSQGVTVNWNNSNPYTGFVTIAGSSFSLNGTDLGSAIVSGFICTSPYGTGSFTVPSYVLLSMVAGQSSIGGFAIPTGSLSLGLNAPPVRFNAPSIDYAVLDASSSTGKSVNYQ